MSTLTELTDPYSNFMLGPRAGPGVCGVCFTFTEGYERCFQCFNAEQHLAAVAPISYSVARGQLHLVLAGYKRQSGSVAARFQRDLAAVLWRYVSEHEHCVAAAAGARAFDIVTTVPSSDRDRDDRHPLRRIVSEVVDPTRGRHQRLLRRSSAAAGERALSVDKYCADRRLAGESVLLIDDTWTTGANAQSAAAALRAAGAGVVAAVVIGRHVRPEWRDNEQRLRRMPRPFSWSTCAWHEG